MFRFLLRTLWRLLIFILGIFTLFMIVTTFWPDTDNRFAIIATLFAIYCLTAYVVIPNLFRIYHIVIEHDHIPLYVTTGDGWASDPVNLAIVCRSKDELRKAMKSAGWYEADQPTLRNSFRELKSILFNTSYPEAPVSSLYLFNRRHDIAFEIPTNPQMSARTRHHVRFWQLKEPREDNHDRGHFRFWSRRLVKWLGQEKQIWIGACTYDFKPVDIRWRTGTITHGVRHNDNEERDFIISTLQKKNYIKSIDTSEPGEQLKFRGQSFRTIFTTDGSIKIIKLKQLRK